MSRISAVSSRNCAEDAKLRANRMTPPTRGLASRARSAPVSVSVSTPSMTGPRTLVVSTSVPRSGALAHQRLHLPYRRPQADEDAARDDRMADVQLAHAGDRRDGLHVDVVQRMSGIEAHAEVAYRASGGPDPVELDDDGQALRIAAFRMKRVRIRAHV